MKKSKNPNLAKLKGDADIIAVTAAARGGYDKSIDLSTPSDYYEKVQAMYWMKASDALFRYLISRVAHYGANGIDLELTDTSVHTRTIKSVIQKLKDTFTGNRRALTDFEKEESFWSKWSDELNSDVPGYSSGLNNLTKWILLTGPLTGTAIIIGQKGYIESNGEMYKVPVRISLLNPLHVKIVGDPKDMFKEDIYLRVKPEIREEGAQTPNDAQYADESDAIASNPNFVRIPAMSEGQDIFGEVIKFNWSPADAGILYNRSDSVTIDTVYPEPPFAGLIKVCMLRQALWASDLATLEGIINTINIWKIGNDNVEIVPKTGDSDGQEGTIGKVKNVIEAARTGRIVDLFLPYWVSLEQFVPDMQALLGVDKYQETVREYFNSFGIFVGAADARQDFGEINIANFEEMVDDARMDHVLPFYVRMFRMMISDNPGTLSSQPAATFHPINTKGDKFREQLLDIHERGRVSNELMLRNFGINSEADMRRLVKEAAKGTNEVYEDAVPVTFKQTAMTGDNPRPGKREVQTDDESKQDKVKIRK